MKTSDKRNIELALIDLENALTLLSGAAKGLNDKTQGEKLRKVRDAIYDAMDVLENGY